VLQDVDQLLDRIAACVDEAPRDRDAVERTLTDGYAQALALEAERYRLQRRLAEVAQGLARDGDAVDPAELATIAARLEDNSGDLTRLRDVLGELRKHADALRPVS
jgi:septal ring factor EnvC (AmiA/AmiB activator)